jgi:hypothetical protein
MKRIVLASVALMALAWLSGCSSGSSSPANSGEATPSPSLLSGQFAFVLGGSDATASPYVPIVMAGSFTADGKGNITAGDIDVNDNGVHSTSATPLSGTYAFDTFQTTGTIGYGALGTIVLTNTVGSITHTLKFGFSLNSGGTFGSIADLSANSFVTAGTMQKQTVLTLSGLANGSTNSYVVELDGRNLQPAAVPTSVIGRLTLAAAGTTTVLSFDRSMSGVGTAGPSTPTIGTFSATDGNGRGTFTVNFAADALALTPTQAFAYYAISANRFIAVETDANGTVIADAESQGTIPANANTTGSVFGMAGIDTVPAAPSEISAVGQLVISSLTSGTIADDSNDNGGIQTNAALAIPTVTYNTTTGRGTATVTNGVASGFANSLVFYLTGTGGAGFSFIMDGTSLSSNRAMSGPLTAQTGVGSFSTASDLPGAAIVRAKGSAASDAQAFVAEFSLTNVAATYALVADQRFPNPAGSTTIQTLTDSPISPVTVGALSAATGRGTFTIVSQAGTETLAFYVIQPNQVVFIDISPLNSGLNGPSPLFLATPD